MATSRALRRPARALVVAAVAAVSLTLAPGSGHADPDTADPATPQPAAAEPATPEPTTAAEAQDQVAELNHQLEVVTEQYNDARIVLDEREADVALAAAELDQVNGDIADLDIQVRDVARGAYTGEQLVGFTVLMTSGSPQEFLDKVNTLDAISAHSNGLVVELGQAQQRARDLAAQAEAAQAQATAAAADVDAKRTRIEADLPVLEELLASLTEQERQEALARAHEVSTTTVSREDSAGSERASRSERSAGPTEDEPERGSSIVAPTQAAQIAVDTAYAQLGKPYQWGAAGPNSFDCSGLTSYSYAAAGINLPHSSSMQSTTGVYVPTNQLLPGDLVFFYSPVSHVGIYIGNGQMIHAPNTGSVVSIMDINANGWDYSHGQRIALP